MRSGIHEDALQVMFEGGAVREVLVNLTQDVAAVGGLHKVTQQRLERLLLADCVEKVGPSRRPAY